MLLMWTDNLSVGIKKFDDDHKQLIQLTNELHRAVQAAGTTGEIAPEEIEIVLRRLENYSHYHCTQEEQAMELTGYPELEQHKREHRKLYAMLTDLSRRFRGSTNPKDGAELMQFMFHWITRHIYLTDKMYSDHLRGKELFPDDFERSEPGWPAIC